MPLKLIPPRAGKSPNWTIRGTYLGVYVDRSSKTDRKPIARQRLELIERAIERGDFSEKPQTPGVAGFIDAAVAYMKGGGPKAHLDRLILHFGETPVTAIDQKAVDAAAILLCPDVTAATRNRQIYTPVSAVLHAAGVDIALKRPKGAKGRVRTDFLTPADAALVIGAAEVQDPAFALLLKVLLYTGCRIGEALALRWEGVDLDMRLAYLPTSKNDDPRTMLLRAELVAALRAVRPEPAHGPVFPFRRGGGLKDRLTRAKLAACGLAPPKRRKRERAEDRRAPAHRLSWVTFHTFRHTWATWMRRYGGLDVQGLVATKNWRDPRSASRYSHVDARAEWDKVDALPAIGFGGKTVD